MLLFKDTFFFADTLQELQLKSVMNYELNINGGGNPKNEQWSRERVLYLPKHNIVCC